MIHTPIQKLEFPNDRNVRLYCKREDLLPFSLGGNKVRIGRAFFQDMQEKNKDCMIIYGNSTVRKLRSTTDKAEATAMYPGVTKMLDKLAKVNIIHKNKASNLKSKLAIYINKLA